MKNYRVGYVTGGVVREIRKGAKRLGEAAKKHVARKFLMQLENKILQIV